MGQEAQARRATYAWPNHSGDLAPPKARRLRTLEAENARLMTLLAVHRDNEGRQEIRQKNGGRAGAVRAERVFACERGPSERT